MTKISTNLESALWGTVVGGGMGITTAIIGATHPETYLVGAVVSGIGALGVNYIPQSTFEKKKKYSKATAIITALSIYGFSVLNQELTKERYNVNTDHFNQQSCLMEKK